MSVPTVETAFFERWWSEQGDAKKGRSNCVGCILVIVPFASFVEVLGIVSLGVVLFEVLVILSPPTSTINAAHRAGHRSSDPPRYYFRYISASPCPTPAAHHFAISICSSPAITKAIPSSVMFINFVGHVHYLDSSARVVAAHDASQLLFSNWLRMGNWSL